MINETHEEEIMHQKDSLLCLPYLWGGFHGNTSRLHRWSGSRGDKFACQSIQSRVCRRLRGRQERGSELAKTEDLTISDQRAPVWAEPRGRGQEQRGRGLEPGQRELLRRTRSLLLKGPERLQSSCWAAGQGKRESKRHL